jgi:hypothetical protein
MITVTSDQVISLVRKLQSACFNLAGVGVVGRAEIQRLLAAIEVLMAWAADYGLCQTEAARRNLKVAKEYLASAWMHAQVSPEWENVRPLFEDLRQLIEGWEIPTPSLPEDA